MHPLAGKPATSDLLVDIGRLEKAYYENRPDPSNPIQLVRFGTSGHRGTSVDGTFTESHILAITQAICDYRKAHNIDGPLYLGKDTHALSKLAELTALEVLVANEIDVFVQEGNGFVPTPVISRAIVTHNRVNAKHLADGIIITPSHNPPEDGGFKYNPPHGGPADTRTTRWIQDRANELLKDRLAGVRRISVPDKHNHPRIHPIDFLLFYVRELSSVIDVVSIASSRVRIGVDPLGGSSLRVWQWIREYWGMEVELVNDRIDPTFSFMRVDHDGKIRMDCSSPYAMAGLTELRDRFDIAMANDPDADRHGIVTRSGGLMNPNHFLAVAVHYLLNTRRAWLPASRVGKTVVSSSFIDRVTIASDKLIYEVPVGFKWFAHGLLDGSLCFGGEESAGASFLQKDGQAWTTDKDGIVPALLAAEILAKTGKDPFEVYEELVAKLGRAWYKRIDLPASEREKNAIANLKPAQVPETYLAGDPIIAKLTNAPGNGEPIGGIKVITERGWFAIRPSGTEAICKLYAESFVSEAHLDQIIAEARLLLMTVGG